MLVAVSEMRSITKAAEQLHLTPSAVSTSISELERRLGTPLTIRLRAKGVWLTPTGEDVVQRARELLDDALSLQQEMHGGDELVGRVSLGCYSTLGPSFLPPLIQSFSEAHRRATIDFFETSQDELRDKVERGHLDLCLVYGLDLPQDWHFATLLSRQPMIALPAEHPIALATAPHEPVDLDRLATEPMILLDAPPSSYHAQLLCSEAGFAPLVRYRTRNYETARALVGWGQGWSLLIQRPYSDTTYRGHQIALRPIGQPQAPQVSIGLTWSRARPLSRPAQAFLEIAKKVSLDDSAAEDLSPHNVVPLHIPSAVDNSTTEEKYRTRKSRSREEPV